MHHEDLSTSRLDPQDWPAATALGSRMVADLVSYHRDVRDRPAWQPVPPEVRSTFTAPLPREGIGADATYDRFKDTILPYPTGNLHPRFWGWVMGNGTVTGAFAGFLANAMNCMTWAGDQASTYVEEQVLTWCQEIVGYPADATGLLVTGASMGTLVALASARARFAPEATTTGVASLGARPVLYASRETHLCVRKAWELLGLGSDTVRMIPVTDAFEIDVAALVDTIDADVAAGLRPAVVVGNAGTVNTGAIDPLAALADVSARYGMWFHVDGAIGAPARAVPSLAARFVGLERSDSVVFDFHKWLHVPYGVGCVMVRHPELQRAAFEKSSAYLSATTQGFLSSATVFGDLGLELSRDFRALKVWMTVIEHGWSAFARAMEDNCGHARLLADLVDAAPDLERLAPVSLNIVCFRYTTPHLDAPAHDALNQQLLIELQTRGIAVPSHTRVNGAFALRVAITNHRSRADDFRVLVREARRIGAELARDADRGDVAVA